MFTKGLDCLSDSDCCPGFVCSKDNAQEKGFCSSGVQPRRDKEFAGESETNEEAGAQDPPQLVSICI